MDQMHQEHEKTFFGVLKIFFEDKSFKTLRFNQEHTISDACEFVKKRLLQQNLASKKDIQNYVMVEKIGSQESILNPNLKIWFVKSRWKGDNSDNFYHLLYKSKLNIEESKMLKTGSKTLVRVCAEDGSFKTIFVDETMTCGECVEMICKKSRIDPSNNWKYKMFEKLPTSIRVFRDSERVMRIVNFWELNSIPAEFLFKQFDSEKDSIKLFQFPENQETKNNKNISKNDQESINESKEVSQEKQNTKKNDSRNRGSSLYIGGAAEVFDNSLHNWVNCYLTLSSQNIYFSRDVDGTQIQDRFSLYGAKITAFNEDIFFNSKNKELINSTKFMDIFKKREKIICLTLGDSKEWFFSFNSTQDFNNWFDNLSFKLN
ncbi:hypothetical protein M0811_03768 [Anaeramoeba ignava]|uniref:Ras-associating domain-containing protein n=1 Tax=Anaeramoeba ignava TaxID=1746090 RepID=A0A9Q0LWD0_ANAIG|nr:hypothetical protein M0811_03768 [Anaeramoeba ignava]